MKVHEKAALYDSLKKDVEELLQEMAAFKINLETIPQREDLAKFKEENPGHYYASCVGSFSAMSFVLDMKLSKYKGIMNWYNSQK